jgi:cyclic-di-GMP-binding protein
MYSQGKAIALSAIPKQGECVAAFRLFLYDDRRTKQGFIFDEIKQPGTSPHARMNAMHLRLSLPPRADTPDTNIDIRPAEMERWLKKLPLLNVPESTQRLTRQLFSLNRMALNDKRRLQLLESMRAPIQHVSRALRKTYLGLPLPLPDKAHQTVVQVRQLHTEMAFGYKLIVFNSTAVAKLDHAEKSMVAVALHRAIRYLTELLFHSYELYGPPPEGAWHEIHQLYRYAELLGIADAPLNDKLNDTLTQVSIGHAYKQALLLDFSDPYHLPAFLLARIYRYLDRWAGSAQLSPGVAALKSHCQFLINLDHDRAGAVNTETSPTIAVHYRLLNTTELARVVHQQLKVLQAGQQPDPDGLEKNFFTNLGHDMLLRLIGAWGVNPKRVFTRSLRENRSTQVSIGIDAINFFVNGERFTPSTSEVGPPPRRTAPGPEKDPLGRAQQPDAFPASTLWDLTDESAGGYALTRSGGQSKALRVGDLLASRPETGGGGWEIGIVRWVRSSGTDNLDASRDKRGTSPGKSEAGRVGNERWSKTRREQAVDESMDGRGRPRREQAVEIGVQRLSPSAAAVAILPLEESRDRYNLALALPEVHTMKQPATLLTPRGFFKSGRILYLDNSYRARRIKATKLVELSGSFERFQYETIDA